MRETSDPPPERKPPSFSCFLIISPFHSDVFLLSLSHTLSDHPKLSMDSQLTQQEATRFRLLWEEFLLVSSWWFSSHILWFDSAGATVWRKTDKSKKRNFQETNIFRK